MIPDKTPKANSVFTAPKDLDPSQVLSIHAFQGIIPTGNLEGSKFIVVAWRPTPGELEALAAGNLVYLSCLGSLPPHFITTNFAEAIYES